MREEMLRNLPTNDQTDRPIMVLNRSDPETEKDLVERAVTYLERLYRYRIRALRPPRDTACEAEASIQGGRHIIDEEPQKNTLGFLDLPPNIQIHILSYLDVVSLCRASRVCLTFCALTHDGLLWEKKLRKDCNHWDVVDHKTHPAVYKEANTDLSAKQIYLQCCPECRRYRAKTRLQFNIPKLSFYLGLSVPRIVMFGPGLETSTSLLVRNLLWDKRSPVTVNGMFPGEFEGIGSGVCLQFDSGQLNLITLYATTRHERENAARIGADRRNKLMIAQQDIDIEANMEVNESPTFTLSQPVRELCTTVDAFIYVVDATLNNQRHKVDYLLHEFQAMMTNRWLQPKAPLLVLSCVPEASVKALPSVQVADVLELCDLSRPWQVRSCHVNTLYGFLPGISWLLQEVMHS